MNFMYYLFTLYGFIVKPFIKDDRKQKKMKIETMQIFVSLD